MTVVFKPVLERMAKGSLEKLYAQAAISVEKEGIVWDGRNRHCGSIAVYSKNDVEILGTAKSLHPVILLKESCFQGNTTLHYELIPGKVSCLEEHSTDGVLICYNGGEIVIPLQLKAEKQPSESSETEGMSGAEGTSGTKDGAFKTKGKNGRQRSFESKIREELIKITRLNREKLILQKQKRDVGRQKELQEQLLSEIQLLVRLNPDCVRYRLYEAAAVLEAGDLVYASRLESRIRGVVLASKKKHYTEYCMLLDLQYRLARATKQFREAGVRKQQLRDYITMSLEKEPLDPDLVLILCGDCLNLENSIPMDLWEMLSELYQCGNNSPYLYFYGACLFQNPEVGRLLDTGLSPFAERCSYEGVRSRMISKELAEQIARCRPERYTPYIWHVYEALYREYPSKPLLAALCMVMIRCDVRNEKKFVYFEQAVNDGIGIARLYDYYMYTVPGNYEKPVKRDILLYFLEDEYVNAQIYTRLCLNILQFYKEDPQIFGKYKPKMEEFLCKQIMRSSWSEDLAVLADKILTADMLDSELARALLPMLYLVEAAAEVPDGYEIVYQSGIYKEAQRGIFRDGRACLWAPGGSGRFYLKNRLGKRVDGVNLQIRSLIQKEELIHSCEQLCLDDEPLLLLKTYERIQQKAYGECDFRLCLQYLKDKSLDMGFRKQLLDFILGKLPEFVSANLDFRGLCRCVGMMDQKQLADFTGILIQKGYYTEASELLVYLPTGTVDTELLLELAGVLAQYPENKSNKKLINLLSDLMDKNLLDDVLLQFLSQSFSGGLDQLIQLFRACQRRRIFCPELNRKLLLRLTMKKETDFNLFQEVFAASVNLGHAELLIQAALNRICSSYLCEWCELEMDVVAALQSVVIHAGDISSLTNPCQLACLKYDHESGLNHEIEHIVLKEMCQNLLDQGILLDFVQEEAAEFGFDAFPVIQVNLSKQEGISAELYDAITAGRVKVQAEYYIEGEEKRYRITADQAYACLYSAGIVLFAGETAYYRFHLGNQSTAWQTKSNWNYEPGNSVAYPLSDRYRMLQQIAVCRLEGRSAAKQMQEFDRILKMVECIGKKFKES
ncbi:MAG: DUF5717 family protein [Lachnospiraceae bacterium]|nr:DUF5717 family protein [Lachnospiraceae bacterium]